MVHSEDNDTSKHIEHCHERNQFLAYACDGFDTAENYDCRKDCDNNAYAPKRNAKVLFAYRSNGIYLRRAADTKGCETCKDCECHAEPFHIKPALQCIHGAALHTPVFRLDPVLYSYVRLRVLRSDSEHTGKPAPENRSRSADGNRRAHADDVTSTDCSSQSCRQRAKVRYLSLCVRIFRN